MMYVEVLDVDEGGMGEHEAENLLRTAILGDPRRADVAWMNS